MYRFLQAGIIAQELLAKRLKEHRYNQSKTMPRLWTHELHPNTFSLLVDNFRVKYIREEKAQHLIQAAQKYYTCFFKKEGERCWGLAIEWDYSGKKVHLSMPTYVEKTLKWFQHPPPIVLQDELHQHVKKTYGANFHEANPPNTSPPLDKAGKKFIQEVTGVFLYLAQAVDSMMLTALSALASEQAAPTEKAMQKCLQFLDYAAFTRRCNCHLPSKQYETRNTQQCTVPI